MQAIKSPVSIMNQGIVFDIRGFSINDGPGIRTTVFLKGCLLRCLWCHNPESQKQEPANWHIKRNTGSYCTSHSEALGKPWSAQALLTRIVKDRLFYEESGGGLTLSGGEPLLQPDFCLEILRLCRQQGIHTALDTSGYADPGELEAILPFCNLVLFDLKLLDPKEHKQYTGTDNLVILENLNRIYRSGTKIWIRIPLVEGITDTARNLSAMATFLRQYEEIERIELLPYHAMALHKYKRLSRSHPLAHMPNYPNEKIPAALSLLKDMPARVYVHGRNNLESNI